MAMYSISTRPLIDTLSKAIEGKNMMQAWFADDSSAGEQKFRTKMEVNLPSNKIWWDGVFTQHMSNL